MGGAEGHHRAAHRRAHRRRSRKEPEAETWIAGVELARAGHSASCQSRKRQQLQRIGEAAALEQASSKLQQLGARTRDIIKRRLDWAAQEAVAERCCLAGDSGTDFN